MDFRIQLTNPVKEWVDALSEDEEVAALHAAIETYDILWPVVTNKLEQLKGITDDKLWAEHITELSGIYRQLLYHDIVVGVACHFYQVQHTRAEFAAWLSKVQTSTVSKEQRMVATHMSYASLVKHILSAHHNVNDFRDIVGEIRKRATWCTTGRIERLDAHDAETQALYEEGLLTIDDAYTQLPDIAQEIYAEQYEGVLADYAYIAGKGDYMSRQAAEDSVRYQIITTGSDNDKREETPAS